MAVMENATQQMRKTRGWLGGLLMVAAIGMAGPALAALPATQHYGSVEYVTGGFGLDESTAIKAAMSDYPLAFTFAARNGGRSAYVSKVQLVVRDQYDATVLNVESQGPFLLAKLAPGTYQVHATYQNQTQSRQVRISSEKGVRVVFEWVRQTPDAVDTTPAPTSSTPSDPTLDTPSGFAPGSIPGLD